MSCTASCASHGLLCTEQELFNHNNEVDSSAELLSVMVSVDASFSLTSCTSEFGSGFDVPVWRTSTGGKPEKCYFSSSSRALSTFNCEKIPDADKRRICYCHTIEPNGNGNN